MADLAIDMPLSPIEYFRVKSGQPESRATAASTRQAVDAFVRFVGGAEVSFDSFDESLIGEWVTHLLYNGYSLKTAAYYVKRLAALYAKAVADRRATATDAFANVRARLNDPAAQRLDGMADRATFDKLRSIVCADYSATPTRRLAKDMLLFAVYNGGLTFGEIASFKKDDYHGDDEHIRAIVDRYSRPKNTYLFPLDHSKRTPRRLAADVEVLVRSVADRVGLRVSDNPGDTALDLWCMAAMRCGIAAADIAACVGSRAGGNAVTAFVRPADIAADTVDLLRRQVTTALADNPRRWYAMHLRRHVDYDMLIARLKERHISLPDIYYPMEDIVRKVGHRRVFETRPVIAWLVFFRERVSELNNLYSHIGDLAWGYRLSRDINAPYAVISLTEIAIYQRALGTFSADTELLDPDSTELKPGDRLVIIGGILEGRPATFAAAVPHGPADRGIEHVPSGHETDRRDAQHDSASNDTKPTAGTKTVYRILLDGGNYREWVVEQDPRLVKKITETHYRSLLAQP